MIKLITIGDAFKSPLPNIVFGINKTDVNAIGTPKRIADLGVPIFSRLGLRYDLQYGYSATWDVEGKRAYGLVCHDKNELTTPGIIRCAFDNLETNTLLPVASVLIGSTLEGRSGSEIEDVIIGMELSRRPIDLYLSESTPIEEVQRVNDIYNRIR